MQDILGDTIIQFLVLALVLVLSRTLTHTGERSLNSIQLPQIMWLSSFCVVHTSRSSQEIPYDATLWLIQVVL